MLERDFIYFKLERIRGSVHTLSCERLNSINWLSQNEKVNEFKDKYQQCCTKRCCYSIPACIYMKKAMAVFCLWIRVMLTGHGRPCWVTHLIFCHLPKLKKTWEYAVKYSKHFFSQSESVLQLYLWVSQFTVSCFVEWTALSCKFWDL